MNDELELPKKIPSSGVNILGESSPPHLSMMVRFRLGVLLFRVKGVSSDAPTLFAEVRHGRRFPLKP